MKSYLDKYSTNPSQTTSPVDLPSYLAKYVQGGGTTPTDSPSPYPTSIPQDVRDASQVTGTHDYDGLCEKFVEEMSYGRSNMYPTAVDAWNDYTTRGKAFQGIEHAKPGDLLYFAPDQSNQGAGHTAIFEGGDKMVSATYNGVREDSVSDWQNKTGQQLLGHVVQGGQNVTN